MNIPRHSVFVAGSAGTTECFKVAREYLDEFETPVDIVAGNHDLEGLGEFHTDRDNLLAFQVHSYCFSLSGIDFIV